MKEGPGDSVMPQFWDGFVSETMRRLDDSEWGAYRGRRVLITGAGGYLGAALARSLASVPLADLVLLDQSEYGLYRLEQEVPRATNARFVVGNLLDRELIAETFREHAPEIVIHAAALKHVPLMETNPLAAAQTNTLGTQALVKAALEAGTERFVFLSTDKAADPISIMGATKRIAEQVVLRTRTERQSAYTVARLCNVLGSTGSVAPLFCQQIANGGPITLTDSQATRYFVSQQDAVRFLLRAGVPQAGTGLSVPRLERPRLVKDLAEYLIHRIRGAEGAMPVLETGLRPGEKLHEALLSSAEQVQGETEQGAVSGSSTSVVSRFDPEELTIALSGIERAVKRRDVPLLLRSMQAVLPGFRDAAAPTVV